MTKILLFGATGPAGIRTLIHALTIPGVEVLVYARTPSKIPDNLRSDERVTILPGGLLSDTMALREAVAQRPDVIISLLGPPQHELKGWINPFSSDYKTPVYADAYAVIIEAMKEFDVRRILVMGTISIPDPHDKSSVVKSTLVWLIWALVHKAWKNIVAIGKFFDTVKPVEDGIDWTIFRLGNVIDGEFESVTEGYVGDGKTTITVKRSELAYWLVDQAMKVMPEWVGQKPVVSTASKRALE